MRYLLAIKSHCEAPDYEDEVEARSKKEAIRYFLKRINRFNNEDPYDENMIKDDVISEAELNKPI